MSRSTKKNPYSPTNPSIEDDEVISRYKLDCTRRWKRNKVEWIIKKIKLLERENNVSKVL